LGAGLLFTASEPSPARCQAPSIASDSADLEEFAHHRPRGLLTVEATERAWNGYLLTVARPCGWCLNGGSHQVLPLQTYCLLTSARA